MEWIRFINYIKKGKFEKYDWDLAFNKADKYSKISESYSDKKIIPNDFIEFSQNYISDSEFQKAHMDFDNLIAIVGACDKCLIFEQ